MSVYADRRVMKSAFVKQAEFSPHLLPPPSTAMEMAIEEFEAWDTDTSLLPPVTRLYHLSPIGLGTPMVESLSGYIVRLAEAHCVSAGVLYGKKSRRWRPKATFLPSALPTTHGYSTHTINGFGSPASRFCASLRDPHWAPRSILPDAAHLVPRSTRPFLASPLPGMVRELFVCLARSKPTDLRASSLDPSGRNHLPVPSPDLAPSMPAL